MPYWHIVVDKDKNEFLKYGQWAPFMDLETYQSLIEQAKEAGYDL